MSSGKMPDLNALMKQAQKLQGDVAKVQEELAKMECDGAAGGGLVSATAVFIPGPAAPGPPRTAARTA